MRSSNFKKSRHNRVYVGYIGESAAHLIDEYVFDSIDDFEKALADISKTQFQHFAKSLAELIIHGTQRCIIHRIVSSRELGTKIIPFNFFINDYFCKRG